MRGNVAKYVLADTGFWFGLLDPRDGHHRDALEVADLIDDFHVVVPWPSLYEVINTRFLRSEPQLHALALRLGLKGIVLFDDEPYRAPALDAIVRARGRRTVSLVDAVLNAIVEDVNVGLHYLATFNPRDFHATCQRRGIEILPDEG